MKGCIFFASGLNLHLQLYCFLSYLILSLVTQCFPYHPFLFQIIGGGGDFVNSVSCLSFSRTDGGRHLAAVDESNDHMLSVWEWEKGENGHKITGMSPTLRTELYCLLVCLVGFFRQCLCRVRNGANNSFIPCLKIPPLLSLRIQNG